MGLETAIGIGGSLLGGLIEADSAGDAADAQLGAAREANALQDKWMTQTRNDNLPALGLRNSAINELMTRLGLGPSTPSPTVTSGAPSYDALRSQLLPNYTLPGQSQAVDVGDGSSYQYVPGRVDETALEAAIQARMQPGMQSGAQTFGGDPTSANFGSLLKPFTGADLQNEPGYQFTRDEGMRGIQGSAAARGGLYSGATLKALTKFNSGLADQTYGQAFNRDAASKDRVFGYLTGAGQLGQGATASSQAMQQNSLNNISSNLIGMGNAQAAAGVARGNAWGNAINGAVSAWGRRKQGGTGNPIDWDLGF